MSSNTRRGTGPCSIACIASPPSAQRCTVQPWRCSRKRSSVAMVSSSSISRAAWVMVRGLGTIVQVTTVGSLYNLARFDLVSIRLVVDCVQHGSLSAAAREAHLALAAASRRMRELEDAIGEPLFERHGRGLLPTAAGRVFARHAVGLLQSLEQMGSELADLRSGVAKHVRLCASTAAINQFLPPLLARYARQQREVRVELEEQVSSGVVTALREGRADLGEFVEG